MALLPPNAERFSIHVVGDKTEQLYKADFTTTQILSHRQNLANDRLLREYLGGENPKYASEDARQRASFLADINSAILNPIPQFWREKGMGLDLLDDNVLMEIWAGVQRVQAEAVKAIMAKADKDAGRLKSAVERGVDAKAAAEEEKADE